MQYPNTNKNRDLLPPYQSLGKRLRALAILVLVSAIVSLLDFILVGLDVLHFVHVMILNFIVDVEPLSLVVSLLAIVIFIFQVLIIIHAKNAAKTYTRPALDRFASLFILCLVLVIVSEGIIYMPIVLYFLSEITGTTNIFQFSLAMALDFSLASDIVNIGSIGLQLAAWFSMAKFFKTMDDVSMKSRGINWTRLLIVAIFVQLGMAIAIGIPLTIMDYSIYLVRDFIVIIVTFEILYTICLFALDFLVVIGYFKLGTVFQSLVMIKTPEFVPPSGEIASPRIASFSTSPLENSSLKSEQKSFITCTNCGVQFLAESGMQFCPSCGARIESTPFT